MLVLDSRLVHSGVAEDREDVSWGYSSKGGAGGEGGFRSEAREEEDIRRTGDGEVGLGGLGRWASSTEEGSSFEVSGRLPAAISSREDARDRDDYRFPGRS
jgi:hypothetical protein